MHEIVTCEGRIYILQAVMVDARSAVQRNCSSACVCVKEENTSRGMLTHTHTHTHTRTHTYYTDTRQKGIRLFDFNIGEFTDEEYVLSLMRC